MTPVAEPSQTETRFYGLEIFAADAVLAAVSLGAGRAEPLLGLALTGPVIHAMHDRWGAAGGSLVVRVASPFAGLYVGAAICEARKEPDSFYECTDAALIGFAFGSVVALGIDYFVLARQTTVRPARIQPTVTATPTATTAGLQFIF